MKEHEDDQEETASQLHNTVDKVSFNVEVLTDGLRVHRGPGSEREGGTDSRSHLHPREKCTCTGPRAPGSPEIWLFKEFMDERHTLTCVITSGSYER